MVHKCGIFGICFLVILISSGMGMPSAVNSTIFTDGLSSDMINTPNFLTAATLPGGLENGPYIDKLVFNVITQDDQQVLALQDDVIDLIGDMVDPSFLDTLMAAENIDVAKVLRNGYGYLTINTDKYPYNITAFRRAFAFALDKEAISDDIWDGFSVPQDSLIPQVNPGSIEGLLPYTYYEANIALGNQLLDEAGFIDVDEDGFREAPDGSKFDVLLEVAQSSNIAIEIGQKGAETLSLLGIDATSQPTDFYEYLNRLYFHGDYDIAFLGTTFTDFDLDFMAYTYWSEYADEPYWNFPNFRNATYDSWRDQLLHATQWDGPGGVYEAALAMQEVWVYQCPMVVCYDNVQLSAYRTDKFEGFVNDVVGGVPGWWTNQKVHLKDEFGGPFGDTFRWSNPLDVDTFNLFQTSSSYTDNVLQELYEPLLRRNPDGDIINWLAEDYILETHADNPDVPDGHTRITFDIARNVTWSDASPLSAHDVAFSYNYLIEHNLVESEQFGEELYALYSPTDYTFVAEFTTESYWHLSSFIEILIIPKHQWMAIGDPLSYNPAYSELITSGPFYVLGHVAGDFVELARNPYYFRTPPGYEGDLVMNPLQSTSLSPSTIPTQQLLQDEAEKLWDEWASPSFQPDVDPLLETWSQTGSIDSIVDVVNGNPSVLIYSAPWVSFDEYEELVDVEWKMDFKAFKIVQGVIDSVHSYERLKNLDGLTAIYADKMKMPVLDEFDKESHQTNPALEATPDMSELRDIIGSTSSIASSYTGNGIVIGHIDTGCDFGVPDLQDAYHPGTYDPSGYGMNFIRYKANSSNVIDVDDWLSSSYNLLSYTNASGVYVNVTNWDPYVNNQGGLSRLLSFFIDTYANAWEIELGDFMNHMWKDMQLPDPSIMTSDYHIGFIFQQRPLDGQPYAKVFAPALIYESAISGEWNLVVDWDTAEAWTLFWNGAFYYESINLLNTVEREPILSRIDFDFSDDYAEETYNLTNPLVTKDLDGDGLIDLSLGVISWCYDSIGISDTPIFNGFTSDGRAVSLYFDGGTHGTSTAAHVASRGEHQYYDANNDTYFTMSGIANESQILSIRALSSASELGAYFWACGFDLNEMTSEFTYTGNHQADLITNSWGWTVVPSYEMQYISLVWTILSVPGYLNASYPGVLHVFSAGNEGSGYMTIGPPGCTAGVLTVGASTSYSYLDYLLGPGQEYEGIASFSSKGPTFLGYSKPDVLAPGCAAYAPVPLYSQYFQEWWQSSIWNWGEYSNVTLFSGTSQSAPVAAGAAALVIEALNTRGASWTPDRIKTIIQSTSDALGYDPATEGFGRINVNAACDFAESDAGFILESTDSFDTMMSVLDDAWYPKRGSEIWSVTMPDSALPTGFAEGSLYFGLVTPSSTTSISQNIYTSATGSYLSDLSGWTGSAYYWRAAETHTFSSTTFVYNDTFVSQRGCYGWYDLRTELGATEYDAATTAHSYFTVGVSFADADIADSGAPWMFLYDWTDDNPSDGTPNYWNKMTEEGDELKRLASASDDSNNNMMSFATTGSTLGGALSGNLSLVIHDPKFDTDWAAIGNDFLCTVIFWEAVPTSMIQDTGGLGASTFNWQLTAPTDDAGIYQGFIAITNGTTTVNVPWSFNLVSELSTSEGAVNTITSGCGDELTPFDSPFYGCVDEDPDDYDFRSYTVYNPNSAARYIGVRAIWDDPGSEMQVFLYDHQGMLLESQVASSDTTTALLVDISDPYTGYYHILVHPLSLNGQTTHPVNYTLNVMWYSSIESPVASPTYYSNWNPTPIPFSDYDILFGDHIVANVSLSEISAANLPEYAITSTTLQMFEGFYIERTGNLIIPDGAYNPFDGSPLHLDEFVWEVVEGIGAGDNIRIQADFTNGDCDIFVYWADTDSSTWSSGNDLAHGDMGTGANPEQATIVADRDGALAIGIFDYDLSPGLYSLTVDTRESNEVEFSGRAAWYDTYEFGQNSTRSIMVTSTTSTGIEFSFEWEDVTFNNYFSPDVTVTSPNGGEIWTSSHSITWVISSLNDDSESFSDVWISNDDGQTFMLIAKDLDVTSFVWDTSPWQNMDTYRVRITVSDRGMYGEDISDASFTAGGASTPDVPPIIFGSPDISYNQGETGNELTWVVGDLYPDEIELWIDDSLDTTYPWNTPSTTIIENCDGLSAGVRNYTIYAVDLYGNHASMTILVTVIPDVPFIDEPDDITYQLGTTGHNVTWQPLDNNPSLYRIYVEQAEVYSAAWDGSGITYSIDGQSLGLHNYTLYVEDFDGYHASDTVMIEVVDDTISPVIDHPDDIFITQGTTGESITWSPSDSYPNWFYVYQNGTPVKEGSWTSTIHVSLDGLGIGVYNYTILVTDVAGNSVTDTVYVTVTDNLSPEFLNESEDQTFNEGETGHHILWNVTDQNPDIYIVYVNDTIHSSGSWTSPWMFEFLIESPLFGVWNYTLFVNDTTGFSASDSVIITIRDVTLPLLSHPSDMTIVFGDIGNSISWTATDNNPLLYVVTRNGTSIIAGGWTSGEAIEISLDGLLSGVYVFSIVVSDQAGNLVVDEVTVTVTDMTSSTTTDTTTEPTTPPTTTTPSDILTMLSLIITIGSIVVIVIIVVMIVRARR